MFLDANRVTDFHVLEAVEVLHSLDTSFYALRHWLPVGSFQHITLKAKAAKRHTAGVPFDPADHERPRLRRPISLEQIERELGAACKVAGIDEFEVYIYPPLTEEHKRNPRRYAQCIPDENVFEFADQFRWLPWEYRLGLYAHEIGHVIDPDPAKTEDAADYWGGEALGVLITYDHRWPGKGLQVAVY